MARFTLQEHVQATPEEVFRIFSDLQNAPARIEGIQSLEVLTEGPIGVGTRFRETRILFGKEATETMEITAFDPPRSYAVDAASHGAEYHSEYVFTPRDGGTDVNFVFEAHPQTFLSKVLSILTAPLMKSAMKAMAGDMRDLKRFAEEGSAATDAGVPAARG